MKNTNFQLFMKILSISGKKDDWLVFSPLAFYKDTLKCIHKLYIFSWLAPLLNVCTTPNTNLPVVVLIHLHVTIQMSCNTSLVNMAALLTTSTNKQCAVFFVGWRGKGAERHYRLSAQYGDSIMLQKIIYKWNDVQRHPNKCHW